MAEIRTPPVTARFIADRDEFAQENIAGAVHVDRHGDGSGEVSFWYRCPCGCGAKGMLLVGDGFKPADGPSWNWNGMVDKPTLLPSVHHVGHWHGWLKDGVWTSC
ncbi:DUF6527 family protein [Pseudomonas sp. R2.Fl]|nr:DUF6527 family protein [Pseudomonas sp. R2.Fl]